MRAPRFFGNFGFHVGRQALRDFMTPRKPRHRLLRVVLTIFGVALLAVLLVFGLLFGAAMLAFALVTRLLRKRAKPMAKDARTLDGEYKVLRKPALTTGR